MPQVDVDAEVPGLRRRGEGVFADQRAGGGGVVDQDVDRLVLFEDVLREGLQGREVGDVAIVEDWGWDWRAVVGVGGEGGDSGDEGGGAGGGDVEDDDLAALKGEELDCCGAYAFGTACDEDGLAAKGGVGGVLGGHFLFYFFLIW